MHLAILRTSQTNSAISAEFPDYPELFARLLNRPESGTKPAFSFTSFAVFEGDLPEKAADFEGYIITGSAAGVYEGHSWLSPLFAFIRDCDAKKIPVCGICFGHQAVAKALGGEAEKWPQGWGVGVQKMAVTARPEWMPEVADFSLIYFHQDQVTRLPNGAYKIAGSDFCTNGAFAKDQHIFCLQGHPEFYADYSSALLETLRDRVGDSQTDDALSSLSKRTDSQQAAQWISDFFISAQHGQKKASSDVSSRPF